MKRIFILCISMLMLACSCVNKKDYRPSQFPESLSANNYSFALPYSEKNGSIIVRIRLNGGPQFEGTWDSGCSFPLKISLLEASALVKDGTLTESDFKQKAPVTIANGQTDKYDVYMLKSISFTDENGNEHTIENVPAVIDDNAGTSLLIGLPVMQKLGYSHEISQYEQLIFFKE